jgi:hypothetical protein
MRREFTTLPGAFDSFLFAYLEEAEPEHGMSTSVLSVLARVGLDPWKEAARLATLPRHVAARALASVIGSGTTAASLDTNSVALRLVELLPSPTRLAEQAREAETPAAGGWQALPSKWLIVALVLAAVLMMYFYS